MARALTLLVLVALAPLASAQPHEWPNGAYNPFGHSPIRIHLDVANDSHGYAEEARNAMRYWERGGNHALQWEVRFEEVDNASEADIVFWFRDATRVGPVCGESESALGCARPFDRPVLIEVLVRMQDGTFRSFQQVREVSAHELGHALGLPHSSDPNDLMAPHASSRAATTWRPGDLPRLLAGVGVVLAIMAALAWAGWRALRPRRDVGRVHLVAPDSPCPIERDGVHRFQPAVIETPAGEEDWDVCARCGGGYRADEGLGTRG